MFEKEIAKGIALLDGKYPSWESKIDLNRFEMKQGHSCVLGQVLPNGFYGPEARALVGIGGDRFGNNYLQVMRAFGFSALVDDPSDVWDTLTREWKAAITKRREEAKVKDEIKVGDRVRFAVVAGSGIGTVAVTPWQDEEHTWTVVRTSTGHYEIVLMDNVKKVTRPDNMSSCAEEGIKFLVKNGKKIHAIALVRSVTSWGLVAARDYVESLV